ncbi:hypothetical protein GGI25_000891 [Coemansia spiralis]|uniref:BIR-domain-containing protein n=1 Tax=Coemansia spiralis TaxID=417178 RepID=A0A9W8G6U1_9FUNG|nr:hypothetical protein GGI25_000891 [Coemansia spiralis]
MKQTSPLCTFKQRKDTFLRRGRFRWPYIKYTSYLAQPDTLASAGFAFSPARDAPDNVQCFFCGFELTGWEPTDDPFSEHYAHKSDCNYARLHCRVRAARPGNKVEWTGWPLDTNSELTKEDKISEKRRMLELRSDVKGRLATFSTSEWPHAGRADWNVTPEKLAKAGFYYTPEWPGDDTATCAFCGYALAEWEPDDEPEAEHARRAPDCLYFRIDKDAELAASPVKSPVKSPVRTPVRSPIQPMQQQQPQQQESTNGKRESDAIEIIEESDKDNNEIQSRHSTASPKRQRVSDASDVADVNDTHDLPKNAQYSAEMAVQDLAMNEYADEEGNVEEHGYEADNNYADEADEEYDADYDNNNPEYGNADDAEEFSDEHEVDGDANHEEYAAFSSESINGTQLTSTQVDSGDIHYRLSPTEMQIDDGEADRLFGTSSEQIQEAQEFTQVENDDPDINTVDSLRRRSMVPDVGEWELAEDEENMTVEEFIRACCEQKITSLEASAAQMVSAFMERAESTRERICNMTW